MNRGSTWGHSASTAEERAARRKHQRAVTNLRRQEGRGLVIASVLVVITLFLSAPKSQMASARFGAPSSRLPLPSAPWQSAQFSV